METLGGAWEWYQAVASGASRVRHLAKFWGRLPWGTGTEWVVELEKDNVLRFTEADEMMRDAGTVTAPLDDLAVLVLFSVFEANVRDAVEEQIRPEISQLRHAALKAAGDDVLQAVTEGSFFRVLEPFKSDATNDLLEQVNQVRRYRNWVAHGRRPEKRPEVVQPKEAYERLKQFLELLQPQTAPPS